MRKKISLMLFLLLGTVAVTFAQNATEKIGKISIAGDISKGMFRLSYTLPNDAKKVVWTVANAKGEVVIREKYKKMKAGRQHLDYNFKSAPSGMYTFTIIADEKVVAQMKKEKDS